MAQEIEIVTLHDPRTDEYFVEVRGHGTTTKQIGPIKTREQADAIAQEQVQEIRSTIEASEHRLQ